MQLGRGGRTVLVTLVAVAWVGCLNPSNRRPGFRMSGETVTAPPADWSFTDQHREIQLEASTAFLLRHSVTIWCSSLEGGLYVGARDPQSKRWPGLIARDPEVRLRIDGRIYDVALEPVDDPNLAAEVRDAYARKYGLPAGKDSTPSSAMRYWRVVPRPR
jgi:hypothetical protein